MARLLLVLLVLGLEMPVALGVRTELRLAGMAVNPVRRVVTMLQMMQKKVAEEGKNSKEMFDKFMCQCAKSTSDLEKSIDTAQTKMPQIESSLKELIAEKDRLTNEIGSAKSDRTDSQKTLAEAKGLRVKEATAFKKESLESQANVKALGLAVSALRKGLGAGFLQTSSATILRRLTATIDMSDSDRDLVSSFLSASEEEADSDSSPGGSEIVGILDQMKDTMQKDMEEAAATEETAKKEFAVMVKAKEQQIVALGKQIQAKTSRLGEVSVQIVDLQEDRDDTSKQLKEDTALYNSLKKNCAARKDAFAEEEGTRSEEQIAIADTIKFLNDDDARGLFTKTFPTSSASFLQVQAKHHSRDRRHQALKVLGKVRGPHAAKFALIAFTLKQKASNFDKILKMVDDMVALLQKEQADDDKKKAYCTKELDEAEDTRKELVITISDMKKASAEKKDKVAQLSEELGALGKSIQDLDKDVASATAQRKEEHQAFVENLAANNAAKELLGIAKNRLNKFYNPKLYDPGMAPDMAKGPEEFKDSLVQEGDDDDEQAPSFAQVSMQQHKSSGVVQLITTLIGDLDKEILEMKADESKSQSGYEKYIEGSTDKRATDAKMISEKEAVKADLEEKLHLLRGETSSKKKELANTITLQKDLHEECDWALKNYKARKTARAGEVDALRQAKAVLSGMKT